MSLLKTLLLYLKLCFGHFFINMRKKNATKISKENPLITWGRQQSKMLILSTNVDKNR